MKKLIILILYTNCLFGQNGFFENPSNNILYEGIQNDLIFNFPGIACDSLSFYSTNATIKSNSCRLEVMPHHGASLELLVYKKKAQDSILICSRIYRIKPIPNAEASIGGLSGGSIRKNYLLAQTGLLISNPLNIDIYYDKISYEILLIRNKKVKRKLSSTNFKFTQSEIRFLQRIKKDDLLLIYNINVTSRNSEKIDVNPIQFIVIE